MSETEFFSYQGVSWKAEVITVATSIIAQGVETESLVHNGREPERVTLIHSCTSAMAEMVP